MSIIKAESKVFSVLVHQVDIVRGRTGPDYVFLRTNFGNPCYPYNGTMSVQLQVTRGTGKRWAEKNLPGVDVSETDLETHSAARPKPGAQLPEARNGAMVHSLSDGMVDSRTGLLPKRPVLSLKNR